MQEYPKKLVKYLDTLPPEQRNQQQQLYQETLAQAVAQGFQSPKFWATRQIIAGLTAGQIQHKIQRRMRKTISPDV
ncbi:hypothetical protein ACFL3F_04520 [Planctomycetota bacterium]